MNKNTLAENRHGHGAIPRHPVRRYVHRKSRLIGRSGAPFNWAAGYDVRNTVGQIRIKDQGTNFSCGRQAGAYAQFIMRALQGIREGEISAKSGYGRYCGPDGGMTVDGVETCLGAFGANLEASVPSYDVNGRPLSEPDMRETAWETPQTDADAISRAGYTPVNVPVDIDSIASAAQQYGFVIWEIRGQNNGTWDSASPRPPKDRSNLWAHYMCVIGAETLNGEKTLIALNSWGTDVGVGGVQFFTGDYVGSGYVVDAFTMAKDSTLTPLPGNDSVWAALNRWFRWFEGQRQLANSLAS